MVSYRKRWEAYILPLALATVLVGWAAAQECYSGSEIDAATGKALAAAAQQFWSMSAQGDVAGLKANAVPAVAASFGSIEKAVIDHKELLAQGQPSETRMFVLDATNSQTTWKQADFYCGIYNSPDRTGISLPNLPPGRYALTIAKLAAKEPVTLTLILQDTGKNVWKLGGYYARANTLGGHDGQWFISKARGYKTKGQRLDAWFYYLTAWDLLAPVDFMSTPLLDKLNDETQAVRPADIPDAKAPLVLTTAGRTFKVVELSAVRVNGELYARAQYESANLANPSLASLDNTAVMKALLAKYPELREAFGGMVARATDSAGHEYATLTPMKDL